jgi:hypothetical protein
MVRKKVWFMPRFLTRYKNAIFAGLYSLISISIGFIIPRLMIETYGSNLNGYYVTIRQYVTYFYYLEAGLGASILFKLYKPIYNKDYSEIGSLLATARHFYNRLIKLSIGLIIIFSILLPIIINRGSISLYLSIVIVLLVGIGAIFEYFTASIYRLYLIADQKIFIVHIISSLTLLFNLLVSYVIIINNYSIVLLLFVTLIIQIIRFIFFKIYFKVFYKKVLIKGIINSDYTIDKIDALLMDISKATNFTVPIFVLSSFSSLVFTSIFYTYNIVFGGLKILIQIITSGISASFGKLISNRPLSELQSRHRKYENNFFFLLGFLYSCTLVLIIPFINLYVQNFDLSSLYKNESYAYLFVIWGMIYNMRIPYTDIIYASGKFNLVKFTNIVQIILIFSLSFLLNYFYGLNGVLVAMIIASTYKLFKVVTITCKFILFKSRLSFLLNTLKNLIVLISSFLLSKSITFTINNFFDWIIYSTIIGILVLFLSIIVNYLFLNILNKKGVKK